MKNHVYIWLVLLFSIDKICIFILYINLLAVFYELDLTLQAERRKIDYVLRNILERR